MLNCIVLPLKWCNKQKYSIYFRGCSHLPFISHSWLTITFLVGGLGVEEQRMTLVKSQIKPRDLFCADEPKGKSIEQTKYT
jgi:hypothetical protein